MATEHDNDVEFDKPDTAYEEVAQTRTGVSSEMNALKEQARGLGLTFSNNIGMDALRAKILSHQEQAQPSEAREAVKLTQQQKLSQMREAAELEQLALVRCRIMNMDPRKRGVSGEFITVANEMLGTVRKFIPFEPEQSQNGYHIPRIIYNELISRQFQMVSVKKNNRGEEVGITTRTAPEYNITVLPQLTQEELRELAQQQEAAARLGGNTD